MKDQVARHPLVVFVALAYAISITPIFLPATSIATDLWWLLMLGVAFWMLLYREKSISPLRKLTSEL